MSRYAGTKKITYGFVVQTFDVDGKCIHQEFIAGDQVEWEDNDGDPTDGLMGAEPEYQCFDMIQPEKE